MNSIRTAIVGFFVLQVLTGLLLMTVYSPSAATAWGSVWYIQTQIPFGWLIRGLHHFASDAMILLLLLYGGQLLLTQRYRTPSHLAWWTVLVAVGLTLALSLSGHLLPWDQAGYWGTKVRINILARTPLVGEALARLLIGGREFGNLTLSRFCTLHVLVLPLALGWLFFRNVASPLVSGAARRRDRAGAAALQHLPGAVALAAAMLILLATVWYVRAVLGWELLDAPADPTATDYPARPEWHTLFLYQWLKAFHGPVAEVVGAIVIPSVIGLAFLLFPFAHRIVSPRAAHRAAVGLTGVTALAIACLAYAAVRDDRDPSEAQVAAVRAKQQNGGALTDMDHATLRARQFNRQRAQAAREAKRALELAASEGIPPEGPMALLARDPTTRGPKLFAAHCAACHRYDGHDGLGVVPVEPATSSDLHGFAGRQWIRGLLTDPMAEHYFGRMRTPEGDPAHTRMSKFLDELMPDGADAQRAWLADLDAVAVYLEDESLHPGRFAAAAPPDDGTLYRGRETFTTICHECHSYGGERIGTTFAPDMLGYGSAGWIELMIAEPDHETRYRSTGRERARMPRFKDRITEPDRRLIAEWLHGSMKTGLLSDSTGLDTPR